MYVAIIETAKGEIEKIVFAETPQARKRFRHKVRREIRKNRIANATLYRENETNPLASWRKRGDDFEYISNEKMAFSK